MEKTANQGRSDHFVRNFDLSGTIGCHIPDSRNCETPSTPAADISDSLAGTIGCLLHGGFLRNCETPSTPATPLSQALRTPFVPRAPEKRLGNTRRSQQPERHFIPAPSLPVLLTPRPPERCGNRRGSENRTRRASIDQSSGKMTERAFSSTQKKGLTVPPSSAPAAYSTLCCQWPSGRLPAARLREERRKCIFPPIIRRSPDVSDSLNKLRETSLGAPSPSDDVTGTPVPNQPRESWNDARVPTPPLSVNTSGTKSRRNVHAL